MSKLSDPSVWEKRKTKGKIAIQKMVVDLMELYLHRLKQRRLPYPLTPAMTHFVSQFPYQPTPDQQQAFIDVHKDLTARETPMDRLICGDVDFDKTEVGFIHALQLTSGLPRLGECPWIPWVLPLAYINRCAVCLSK